MTRRKKGRIHRLFMRSNRPYHQDVTECGIGVERNSAVKAGKRITCLNCIRVERASPARARGG